MGQCLMALEYDVDGYKNFVSIGGLDTVNVDVKAKKVVYAYTFNAGSQWDGSVYPGEEMGQLNA